MEEVTWETLKLKAKCLLSLTSSQVAWEDFPFASTCLGLTRISHSIRSMDLRGQSWWG